MEAKVFFSLLGFASSAVAIVVLPLVEAPIGWVVAGMVALLALGSWMAREEFVGGEGFTQFSDRARRAMWLAATAAGLAFEAWVLWVLLDPSPWKAHTFRLMGLTLMVWLVAVRWDRKLTKLTAAPVPVKRPQAEVEVFIPEVEPDDAETPEERQRRDAARDFEDILTAAGKPFHQVEDILPMPYGASFVVRTMTPRAAAAVLNERQQQEFSRQQHEAARTAAATGAVWKPEKPPKPVEVAKVEAVGPGDEDVIARAVEDQYGVKMNTSWVQIDEVKGAGRVRVTVTTQDVLALPHPYVLVNEPLPPRSRIDVGPQVHGESITVDPRGHGAIIGNTGSGKTMFSAAFMSELERLPGRKSIIGTEKVYDWAGQLLDPLLGTDLPLPVEAFEGIDDSLMLFTEAMNEARWRNNLPHNDRHDLHPWWVFIEEAPAFLPRRDKLAKFDGKEWVPSDLLAHNMRLTRSAGIYFVVMAQEWDNAMFGDHAASIKANMTFIVLMRSMDGGERGRAFGQGAASLPNLYNPGEFYVRGDFPPMRGKGRYIQEQDVRLDRLHDGATMTDVAIARAQLASQLPQGRWAPPSDWYAERRPTRMTLEYHNYLRGLGRSETNTAISAAPTADDEFDAALRRHGLHALAEPAEQPQLHVVDSAPARPKLREFIVDAIAASESGMTTAELLAAAVAAGFENTSKSSVENALTALRGRKLVTSSDDDQGRRVHRAA
jgi:hypothetical protein